MKLAAGILSIAILSAVAEQFLPWWSIAVVAFAIGIVINKKAGQSFLMGFAGIAIFWLVAMIFKDVPNDHILSRRMAMVFRINSYMLFMLIISILGGLIGGMAACAGSLLRPVRK